jgi:hypothetical protein
LQITKKNLRTVSGQAPAGCLSPMTPVRCIYVRFRESMGARGWRTGGLWHPCRRASHESCRLGGNCRLGQSSPQSARPRRGITSTSPCNLRGGTKEGRGAKVRVRVESMGSQTCMWNRREISVSSSYDQWPRSSTVCNSRARTSALGCTAGVGAELEARPDSEEAHTTPR